MLYLLRESSTASLTCVVYLFIHVLSKSKEPLFQKAQEVEIQGFSSVQSRFPQVLWNEGFVDSVAHLRKPQETTDAGVEGWTSCVQRCQRKDLSYQNNEIFATSLKAKLWLTTQKCCGCKWLSLFKFFFFDINSYQCLDSFHGKRHWLEIQKHAQSLPLSHTNQQRQKGDWYDLSSVEIKLCHIIHCTWCIMMPIKFTSVSE